MSIVEKMARALDPHAFAPEAEMTGHAARLVCRRYAGTMLKAALTATGLTEAQLEGLANGTMVVVPVDATDAMTNAASDAAYDHFSVDDDYGPWLSSAGYAAAYRAMLAAKGG